MSQPTNNNMSQPQIRHIPIFVEGRDEPVINRNIDTTDSSTDSGIKQSSNNELPKSIFNRVKSFPVRQEFKKSPSPNNRGESPGRTIPVTVTTTTREQSPNNKHTGNNSQQNINHEEQNQTLNPSPTNPIHKIQKIQKDVLDLIDQLEHIVITSRKDKEYLFLDEMLTQNLLKLDTIDTEGSETIKQARRAAIKCINKCIEVLEVKAENGTSNVGNEQKNPLQTSNSNISDYDNHSNDTINTTYDNNTQTLSSQQ